MKKKSRFVMKMFLPVIMLLSAAAGIFFLRAPVLIVSDQYFTELYGKNRTIFAQIQSSLSLFRRVKRVMVPEDIGPDGIAFAVSEVSENPFAVCFPYRYLAGAENYQQQFPSIEVFLFAGKEEPSEINEQFHVIKTDKKTDLYRAGFCAALIAQHTEGNILCYIERGRNAEEKSFFEAGLKAGGKEGSAVFINLNSRYSDAAKISCIVLTGSSDDPFITRNDIPVILNSWGDPVLFPPHVKLVFSDSLWEMLVPAINTVQNNTEEPVMLPSIVKLHPQSNVSFKERNELKRAMKAVSKPDLAQNKSSIK